MLTIGQKIQKLRELRGYKQNYMSMQLGMTQSAYSKIERGTDKIPPKRLKRIAEILEVEVPQLLNFDVQKLLPQAENLTKKEAVLTEDERRHYELIIKQLQVIILFLLSNGGGLNR
ncbi:helix-turn-helix domain-containing protein [Arundinibacter roseus]|uniref:XRE family transcriptional regulator n=1 Tax=Arundinibacter roseus TaxID=2070510 RepID=A0A4V2X817_9BACT|nr:helix-turn-helix transcriptional regulator [Arundinibacter roseus]TDB58085.1 XRE family transcriptional regulator [Arundinibacter roseus]